MSGICTSRPWKKKQHKNKKAAGAHPADNQSECNISHHGPRTAEKNSGAQDNKQKYA